MKDIDVFEKMHDFDTLVKIRIEMLASRKDTMDEVDKRRTDAINKIFNKHHQDRKKWKENK